MLPEETTTAQELEVEAVTTTEALERLGTGWEALWARCPDATPFQSPAWLLPWWRAFGEGDLLALALRHQGELVGFAPLYVYRHPERRERSVRLLGTGNTDYLDVLLAPGFEAEGMRVLFDELGRRAERWDVCDFQQLRAASPLLTAPAPEGWSDDVAGQDLCPVLELSALDEDGVAGIPESRCKKLDYYRRRAGRAGTVHVEAVRDDNLEVLFDALMRLHGARWAACDAPGVLAGEAVQQFHMEVVRGLYDAGLLRLYALTLDGHIVAVYYGLLHRRRAYYYLSGFDPEYDRLSPGHLVVQHAIREAAREGAGAFDFLRGQERYKYRWGAQDRTNHRRRLRCAASGAAHGSRHGDESRRAALYAVQHSSNDTRYP